MTAQVPANEVVDQLREELERQPWYRRFSNAVKTGVGVVLMVVWFVTASGYELPTAVQTGIGAALAILTALGVLQNKNGLTPRGIDDVQKAAEAVAYGRHAARSE